MGCCGSKGQEAANAAAKVVGSAAEGDVGGVLEGLQEGAEAFWELAMDFWSDAHEAAASMSLEGAGDAVGGALGDGADVAQVVLQGVGDVHETLWDIAGELPPEVLVYAAASLADMMSERMEAGLKKKKKEKKFAYIDLSEDDQQVSSQVQPGRSAAQTGGGHGGIAAADSTGTTVLVRSVQPLGLEKPAKEACSSMEKVPHDPLNLDEAGAIRLYTGNALYRKLNEDLRDPDRSKAKPYFPYLRVFLSAFDRLSVANSEVRELYRGCRADLSADYVEGETVIWWSVSSCTPNLDVATGFAGGKGGGGTLCRVMTTTAVSIASLSQYATEEELLLAPGTRLRVTKVIKGGSGFAAEIILHELPGDRAVSVIARKSVPGPWKNANTEGKFDQMVEAVPPDLNKKKERRKIFQEVLDRSWKPVPTRDRKCPKGECPSTPGGCPCVQPGGNPGMPQGIKVHRVLRFEDSNMWARYENRTLEIQGKRGKAQPLARPLRQAESLKGKAFSPLVNDVNEVYLFHGTRAESAMKIGEDGFLLSKAGSNVGTMYGAGVYLTDCCSKADEYAQPDVHGVYRMLMCRVCVGKAFVTEKRDENAADHFLSGQFDSTLGDREQSTGTYREFVFYDVNQVYPEFVIEYTRQGEFYEKYRSDLMAGRISLPQGSGGPKHKE